MKQCPQCGKTYTDDHLNFCLDDGSSLVQSINSTEQETVVLPSPRTTGAATPVRKGVSPIFAYLLVGLLALLAGGAIVGLIMWRSGSAPTTQNGSANSNSNGRQDARNQNVTVNTTNSRPVNSPSPASTPAPVDVAAATTEVRDSLNRWLQALTSKDLDTRMQFYADRLETYYTKRNASASMVRSENLRVFKRYSDLNMEISNLDIDVDERTGDVRTTFDKTFNFEGGDRNFGGAVRSEFRWKKIDGRWKIVSERDLKVY